MKNITSVLRACRFAPQSIFFCLGILCFGAVSTPLSAQTKEWIAKGENNLWSNPNNWRPPGAPGNGDVLLFRNPYLDGMHYEQPRLDMHNDLIDLRIDGLYFYGTSAGIAPGWTLDGNELTLGYRVTTTNPPPPSFGRSSFIFNCPLRLHSNTRFDIQWGFIILGGDIDLNGQNLELRTGDRMEVTGRIHGIGDVSAEVSGYEDWGATLTFNGPAGNTFTGNLTIKQGDYNRLGEVVFDKETGLVVNGALAIAGIHPSPRGVVCRLARAHQIGDNSEVSLKGGGQLLLGGHTETIGNLCLTNSAGDIAPSLVDTGGSTLSVLGNITAVNDAPSVVPTIRGKLGLPGATAHSKAKNILANTSSGTVRSVSNVWLESATTANGPRLNQQIFSRR